MKMATDKDSFCQTCTSDPNFAVICSFLDKFAAQCGIAHPTFTELQEMLEDTQEVSQVLVDIHIKLLRKLRKSFTVDKWERAAIKFCHTYSQQDGWELERFGYKKSRLGVKLKLLKSLLEAQFDYNNRFKTEVNKLSREELRLEPLGRDEAGLTYWCQFDPAAHVRVYREDVDDETWELVAKDREDLVNLINSLSSGEKIPVLGTPVNEDSTSQEIEKPITDTGQVEEEEDASGDEEENSQMSKDDRKEEEMKNGERESEKIVSEGNEIPEAGVDLSSGTSDSAVSGVDLSMKIEKQPESKSDNNICQVRQVEDDRVDILNHMSAKFNQDRRQAEDLSINSAKRPRLELEDSEGPVSLIKRSNLNGTSGRGSHEPLMYVVRSGTGAKALEDEPGDEESEEEPEFSKEVAEPVMLVRGEGSGAECDLGNPRRIDYATELETSTGTGAQVNEDPEEPEFSEEVAEPVMLVIGEGSGAECGLGNPRRIDCATKLETSTDTGAQVNEDPEEPEFSEVIEEPIMFFLGQGSGVECCVGNPTRPGREERVDLKNTSLLGIEVSMKKVSLNQHEPKFSEVIEEPVMWVRGVGYGEDCLTGNPDEKEEEGHKSPERKPKLWSIDTICSPEKGTTSTETSDDGPMKFFFGPGSLEKKVDVMPGGASHEGNGPLLTSKSSEASTSNVDGVLEDSIPKNVEDADPCNSQSALVINSDSPDKIFDEKPSSPQPPKLSEASRAMPDIEDSEADNCTPSDNKADFGELTTEPTRTDTPLDGLKTECPEPEKRDVTESVKKEDKTVEDNSCMEENINKTSQHTEESGDSGTHASGVGGETKKLEICEKSENKKDNEPEKNESLKNNNSSSTILNGPVLNDSLKENSKEGNEQNLEATPLISNSKNVKLEKMSSVFPPCSDGILQNGSDNPSLEKIDAEDVTTYEKKEDKTKNVMLTNIIEVCLDNNTPKGSVKSDLKDLINAKYNDLFSAKNLEAPSHVKGSSPSEGSSESSKTDQDESKMTIEDVADIKKVVNIKEEIKKETSESPEENETAKETIESQKENFDAEIKVGGDSSLTDIKEEELKKEKTEKVQSEDKEKGIVEKVENERKTEIKKGKVNNKKGSKTLAKGKNTEAVVEANGQDKELVRGRKSRTNSINCEQDVEIPNKIRKTTNEEPSTTDSSAEVEKKKDSTENVPRRASRRLASSAATTGPKAVAKKEPKKRGGKAKGKKSTADDKEEKEAVEEQTINDVDSKTEEEPIKEEENEKEKKAEVKKCSLASFSLEAPLDDDLPVLGKSPNFKKTESRKRRSSRRLSRSEEELGEQTGVAEEEEDEAGGKKPRLRGKTKMTKGKAQAAAKTRPPPPESSSEEEEGTEDTKKSKREKENTAKIRGRPKKQKCAVPKGGSTESLGDPSGGESRSPERSKEEPAEGQEEEKDAEEKPKKNKKEPPPKTPTPRKKKNTGLLGLTENDLRHSKPELGAESGVRQSRRIAQIKIKEEAERRAIEEATYLSLRDMKKSKSKEKADKMDKKSGKRKSKSKKESEEEEEEEAYIEPVEDKKKGRKKKKKNDRLCYDINKPWQSSSGSSEEDVEEEEEHYDIEYEDEEDLRAQQLVSDHEFSPESDLEEGEQVEPTPVRRARTAKKEDVDATGGGGEETEEAGWEDTPCQKCGQLDHPEWILLCDKCDQGYHASCLRPPLMLIPEGDWFCPPCQHAELVLKLRETLRTFDKSTKKRENEELRRKRLAYVGISLANVISLKERGGVTGKRKEKSGSGGSSCVSSSTESSSSSSEYSSEEEPVYQLRARRAALQTNYRFNDYDELINSAIQDEMEAVKGAGNQGRGKDIANIVEAGEEEETKEGDGEARPVQGPPKEGEEEEGEDWRPPVVPRHSSLPSGRRKKKRLNNLDVESDENGDSDEDFKGSSEEEEEETDSSKDSEDSSMVPVRRSSRHRVSRIDKEFINDDSESSDEPRRKKSRRLWASSESSDSSDWGKKKKKSSHRVYSRLRTSRGNKKKKQLFDSDSDRPKKPKTKRPKIKYGLSEDDDDEPARRTRGKKISYLEVAGSDTEEEVIAKSRKLPSEDEEEFVPDKEDQEDEEEEVEDVKYDSNDDEISNKDEREGEPEEEEEDKEEEEQVKDGESRKGDELADQESPGEEEDAEPSKSQVLEGDELEGELEEEEIEEEIEEEVDEEEEEEEDDVGPDVPQEEKEEPKKKEEPMKDVPEPVKEKCPSAPVKVKEEEKEVVTPQIRLVPPSKLLAPPVKVRAGGLLAGPTGGFYRPSLPPRTAPLPYRQPLSRYDPSRFGLPPYQPPPPTSYYPPGVGPFPGGPPPYGGPPAPTPAEDYSYMEESTGGGPDEEGMFGGLVSYFSSQREDNLDT